MTTIAELNSWLKKPEGIHLEFKAARTGFNESKDLPDYCAALANEGGGKLMLGVDNDGTVVGTEAFRGTFNKLPNKLWQSLRIRVDVDEIQHPQGRVLVFHIPARPKGKGIQSTGEYHYPWRLGESLGEMPDEEHRKIWREDNPDFSAEIVTGLRIEDIDEEAIDILRRLCYEKSKNRNYQTSSVLQFLSDIGLKTEKGFNYACLILLGKREALAEHLSNAEIILEWRQMSGKTHHDFRKEWRAPFISIIDEIWGEIDKRNSRTPYQEGFVQRDIFAFSKDSIREAVLNAVTHRDYTLRSDVVFITASPDSFFIESPGGFLPGITPENALFRREWRNKRLAEALQTAGLIERSGQGLDIIYEQTIREGKGLPDLSKSDEYHVRLEIPTLVKDKGFIVFLEKIANQKQISFSFAEIYELEKIREQQKIGNPQFKEKFLKLGIIEKVGRKRGTRYILSRQYYEHIGKLGLHTKLMGTSRDQKKVLILNHLNRHKKGTSEDFQLATESSQAYVNKLLQELKKEGKVTHIGFRRSGYWVAKKD